MSFPPLSDLSVLFSPHVDQNMTVDAPAFTYFRFLFAFFPRTGRYMAYLDVHSRAVLSWRERSDFKSCAMSGTRGSSGLGSVRREQMLSSTLEMVRAGLHWSLRMSRQMPPFELMLQW